jgi:hypothetical protein
MPPKRYRIKRDIPMSSGALRMLDAYRSLSAREAIAIARILAQPGRRGLTLAELRRIRGWQQVVVAWAMGDRQGVVSRIERQRNVTIRLLRRYVEALSGELVLIARFRNADVRITQFDESLLPPDPTVC